MTRSPRTRRMTHSNIRFQALSLAFLIRWAFLLALVSSALNGSSQTIISNRHNLSITGPGTVRSTSEDRVCIFCHTPHGGRDVAPLWNRNDPNVSYLPYDSPTLAASVGQPTGASKLCLSCHDGTIALGDLVSESMPVPMSGGSVMPPGPSHIGTDLRDDHPISFNYFESLAAKGSELTAPTAWPPEMQLDSNNELQCTTCHDPHDDQFGQFLVMDNAGAQLCRACHQLPSIEQSPHALSAATWNGGGLDPWPHTEYPDVQSNSCLNCHRSHHAGGREELLIHAREEDNCFSCHDGSVAADNLLAVFNQFASHPVDRATGAHQAGESPLAAADHVECSDCHNPHRARNAPADPPFVMGALEGVTGLDANGVPLDEAVYEYQVCAKCHAAESAPPLATITRQVNSFNTLKEFNPASPSFHPVQTAGRNPMVPSLISPLDESSMIYCTDCHNSDAAAGGGPSGPHGSNYEFLLANEYRTGDDVGESPAAYALCYQCHSRQSILANESFAGHDRHVREQRISCSVCHDPHGIDFGEGNPTNHAHLINFDVSVVQPDPVTGRLEYRSTGPLQGECALTCHGKDHSPLSY